MTLLRLWIGSLMGTTANFAVYLLLAAHVMDITGSALLSSLVFASQWALPVLLMLRIEQACRTLEPRHLLVGASITFALVAACAILVMPVVALTLGLCALSGGVEALVKSGRLVALKRFYDGDALRKSISSLASAMYIGGSLGGVFFAIIPQEHVVSIVLGSAILAHLLSAVVLMGLPHAEAVSTTPERTVYDLRAFLGRIRMATADVHIFNALFCLVLVCGVFQGFHNVMRTALPVMHLNAGAAAIGVLQLVAGIAIIVGVVTYRYAFAKNDGFERVAGASAILCAFLLVSTTLTHRIGVSFALFFAFIFVFELLFMHFQTRLVTFADKASISLVSSFQYAAINFAMFTAVIVGGWLVDATNLPAAATAFAALFCMLYLARGLFRRHIFHPELG